MKRIASILFILTLSIGSVRAISLADSIRREMRHLEGQDLLQAHSNLCQLAASQDDMQYELRCIREFLAEALKQKDAKAEGMARVRQLYCYYNYDNLDSILFYLPASLKSLKKNKTWDYYYNAWSVLVERYIYEEKLQTALLEARKMYADARAENSNYGLGVSSYDIGCIYQTMGRFREAEKSLTESITALSKEEDISQLLSAYNALSEILDELGEYDRLRRIVEEWKSVLDKYREESLRKGYTQSLNGRYLYCTLAAAVAEIETADYTKAGELLKQAEIYAEGRKAVAQFKLLQVQARYYAAMKQYDKAIACNHKNIEIIAASGDSVSLLSVQTQQADFLLKAGRYKEAAELYHEILPHKDRVRTTELANQLDELQTIFEVDKLTLRNEVITTRFYLSLVIGLLLLLAFVLYIIYTRRLRRKNRALYDSILQAQRTQDKAEEAARTTPEEQLDHKSKLYRQLCELMQTEELYKDATLNRDILVERLSTNSVYLADAVHKYAEGATINEFINSYRLRRAASLLTENPSLNINEVEYQSGFNSRSTFNRCFRACYGMSPSEYKVISKEKKIGK